MSKSRVQTQRSTITRARPTSGTREPGEFYVNFSDYQIGFIDPARAPQDLIPVRFFSPNADYATNEHVVYNGFIYKANGNISAGPFNAAQWSGLNATTLNGQDGSYYLAMSNMSGVLSAGQHGSQNNPAHHALVTQAAAGFMSAADKTKLDNLSSITSSQVLALLLPVDGAGSNLDADLLDGQHGAHYLNRSNHTGEQAIGTITGLTTALGARLTDAPADGTLYGRYNGVWVAGVLQSAFSTYQTSVSGSFTSVNNALGVHTSQIASLQTQVNARIGDAPANGQAYARKNNSWVAAQEGLPKAPTVQEVTSSSAVSVPANATHVIIKLQGGGGAGGGCNASNNVGGSAGGGGGGGACREFGPVALAGATTLTVTIGAGGVGVSAGGGNGGGDTSVLIGATTYTAAGGTGGEGMANWARVMMVPGGRGGMGSESGGTGIVSEASGSIRSVSGAGGNSPFGVGGAPRVAGSSTGTEGINGATGTGYGSGGSGGVQIKGQGNHRAGGNGTDGMVQLTWIYNNS